MLISPHPSHPSRTIFPVNLLFITLSGTIEAQKELQRLREELFKCRRSETQKERENVFLQKQLMEITARVSELDDGRGRSSGSR